MRYMTGLMVVPVVGNTLIITIPRDQYSKHLGAPSPAAQTPVLVGYLRISSTPSVVPASFDSRDRTRAYLLIFFVFDNSNKYFFFVYYIHIM